MIVQHEQQHAETMLATHQLRVGDPVLAAEPAPPRRRCRRARCWCPAGQFTMGTSSEPWALDNERPAHPVELPAFMIDTVPVSNGEYAEFIAAGGYTDPRWWSEAGWAHRVEAGLVAPQFWRRRGRHLVPPPVRGGRAGAGRRAGGARLLVRGRCVRPLGREAAADRGRVGEGGPLRPGYRPLAALPVGRRGPDAGARQPRPAPPRSRQPVGAYPRGVSALGVHQLIGDVWEWTSSGWHPYPGIRGVPLPRVLAGVLRRRLPGAARRLVRHRPGGGPRDVPQLGPPDPPADLRRLPLARDPGPADLAGAA